jgi:alanyl-tRNA synthetase
MGMTTDEIRETFLSYFEDRDHLRLPSASLVPAASDATVLLTTAGMHPLVPYFRGEEKPPNVRMASVQKCFRTTDIENVGNTTRHLTFFEMLGNFSIGDYFKQGAVEWAWDLSQTGFGFNPDDIWITVFAGDEKLGLGPDEEAIEAWLSVGVPRERIVECPRSENFWQAGESGPCGPCSELYIDRGLAWGTEDDLPGGENERFLEYWNLVFTQYDLTTHADGSESLAPLPASNIDTGLGLERMAVIQQGVDSVFETDTFAPLMALGRELAAQDPDERALRILADHSRALTFLIADGVVPSNEDRGYILRRIMRRAIQQGRRIGIEPGFLPTFVDKVIAIMAAAYPELERERDSIMLWARSEEEGFGRTLEQGTRLLDEIMERTRKSDPTHPTIPAAEAFQLHDTFGFPIEVTMDIAAEQGLTVDTAGFDELMDRQRSLARAGAKSRKEIQKSWRSEGGPTNFTGYESLEQHTMLSVLEEPMDGDEDRRWAVKLVDSPFYATGGGQIADSGVVESEKGDAVARVRDVLRIGDDQMVLVDIESGELKEGERVVARVDRAARTATQANHTATHLLHAALRERLGTHVRQAGSYVGPDKLRFDFAHGERIAAADLQAIEDRVNEWILRNDPVRPITTTLDEARALGAMALFGEKYGDIVRMVQIGDGHYSRELCGGTHVRSTAEIGVFKLLGESSSAANVRRIEAITGAAAVAALRASDARAHEAASALKTTVERLPEAVTELQTKVKQAAKAAATSNGAGTTVDAEALAAAAIQVSGADVVAQIVDDGGGAKELMDLADRIKGRLGEQSATVLGAAVDGRVHLVAAVTPALVARGVKAGAIVKAAAAAAGGGGGGRDTMAQAGGRDPEKLPDAIAAARAAIEAALT